MDGEGKGRGRGGLRKRFEGVRGEVQIYSYIHHPHVLLNAATNTTFIPPIYVFVPSVWGLTPRHATHA